MDVPQVDFSGMVEALLRHGFPRMQIANAANCSRETIRSVRNGMMPSWHVGTAILKLHERVAKGQL